MAMKSAAVFRYKTEKGPLHKLPIVLKLLLLLPLSVLCMSLPLFLLAAGIISIAVIAFLCGFSYREQLTDLKPALFYALLMYALSVFSLIVERFPSFSVSVFLPMAGFIHIALRLVLIIQLSALLFRSTSSIEIRGGIIAIECFFRRCISRLPVIGKHVSSAPRFAQNISLFLSFIPEIFETWSIINFAWRARAGKNGIIKTKTLVFVLISLSMEKAMRKTNAITARRGYDK
ncbi:MAG: energy-coupling factor transporter transmembrane protein EcfT [Treponema sp.]|nr:energy-coupling factor transporter transmembrane protein EcfT [Treponema sp.]